MARLRAAATWSGCQAVRAVLGLMSRIAAICSGGGGGFEDVGGGHGFAAARRR